MKNKIRKAVIPAGGLGTRFLPATKAQPKEMLPIVDKPTIQYIIEEAVASGIEEILIVTGRNKKCIEDHFDKSIELEMELEKAHKREMLKMVREISNMAEIYFIRQKEPRGLGDAVRCAECFAQNEPFALLLSDVIMYNKKTPVMKQLMDCYDEYRTTILGVQEVSKEETINYGMISGINVDNKVIKVKGMIEKPIAEASPSNIAMMGRYIITPEIFKILNNEKLGNENEIHLTEALRKLVSKEAMYAYKFEGKRYGVGGKLGYLKATVEFALRNKKLRDEFISYLENLEF
ncbi:MAG: UTP--glucose-1-phosphate uridylyltransferase GalU [Clostridium sp.]